MLEKKAKTIRFLAADMVQKANSGHPGTPMGLAELMSVLVKHIKHNPKNPKWLNRDRIVFSGGHASSLVYSYLYLTGYDISMDDLKNFRQFGSKTPGHPEIFTPGVDIATGPLGQGVANAVGFAMAAKSAQNLLGEDLINHKVYCLCGDGDLEEGISYEACALAGKHNLNNLVLIYDSNKITIEGSTNIAWNEDIKVRFEAAGFEVAKINGHDFDEIEFALSEAKDKEKPYLIIANTTIGKGALELEGTAKTHGSPLGEELIKKAKIASNLDPEKTFVVEEDVLNEFRKAIEIGQKEEEKWNEILENSGKKDELEKLLNPDFSKIIYPDLKDQDMATRDSNHKILNALSDALPGFIGGSADLGPSNKTTLNNKADFPIGPNLHFGIREHAMAAICNAYARYGIFIPFSATFFVFSDYLKSSARMAALMGIKHFFVWTHDSIGVGEDGPTHEPIEQLSTFRAVPNFYCFRPADGNENVAAWKKAFELNAPSAFICSRQKLKALPESVFGEISKGAYILRKAQNPKITLVASGSEVSPCLEAASILENEGISTNVVSAPCFDLLLEQDEKYINELFPKESKILAVEAARSLEWYKFADDVLGMETFGESAPASKLFEHFGFTAENIANRAKNLLK